MNPTSNDTPRISVRVQKWGNSMGLRITRAVAELAGFERGTAVTIEPVPGGLLIRRQLPEKAWTEAELLVGLDRHSSHVDELPDLLHSEIPD
ncbi:MAG: hypothetical protein RQ729_10980 [Wenzhouxiangellaceae bacterium]|nr:hypothetical protein [Wenzhouxiangellaceae bacterium]